MGEATKTGYPTWVFSTWRNTNWPTWWCPSTITHHPLAAPKFSWWNPWNPNSTRFFLSCRSWKEVLPQSPSRPELVSIFLFTVPFRPGFHSSWILFSGGQGSLQHGKFRMPQQLQQQLQRPKTPKSPAEKSPPWNALCVSKWRSLPSSCHWAAFFSGRCATFWINMYWYFVAMEVGMEVEKESWKITPFSKFQYVESCWIYKQQTRETFDIFQTISFSHLILVSQPRSYARMSNHSWESPGWKLGALGVIQKLLRWISIHPIFPRWTLERSKKSPPQKHHALLHTSSSLLPCHQAALWKGWQVQVSDANKLKGRKALHKAEIPFTTLSPCLQGKPCKFTFPAQPCPMGFDV